MHGMPPNAPSSLHRSPAVSHRLPWITTSWPVPALLAGVLLGTGTQWLQPALWARSEYAVLLALSLAGWLLYKLRWPRVVRAPWCGNAWLIVVAALAQFAVCGLRAQAFAADALAPALEGKDIRITGVVASMPQANETGVRWHFDVESARWQGAVVSVPPRIDLAWYGGAFFESSDAAQLQLLPPAIRAGERWEMTVRLKAPHGARNPYGFDYELWMWEQGLQATGYVRAGPKEMPAVKLESTARHPVEQLRQKVRDAIVLRLAAWGESEETSRVSIAGVVAALVTGDQRAIDRADWDIFRATGVAHLMSISGLHITLFAWLAATAVQSLWRRSQRLCLAVAAPTAALVAGVLLAGLYAVFSGWGVPAQRTMVMLVAIAVLRLSGRRWPWPHVWLLACACVVIADPWAWGQAGFWLSFIAVAALFASNNIANGALKSNARGRFMALLREQWVVTLALTPLTLFLFGQISLTGFVANFVAIPWVTLVVTPLALAGVLWAPLWDLSAWSLQPLMALLQWLAAWTFAVAYFPVASLWAGVAAVLGGALLAMRLPWQLRMLALPLLVPLLWWPTVRPEQGEFELLAADIGQGNAVLVRTARHTLLYDTGPRLSNDSDAGQRVLVPLLRAMGESVNVVMLSHRDADHTGGAAAVLAQQPNAQLMGSIEAEHPLQALRYVVPCLVGQHWNWDGVSFEVLHPQEAHNQRAASANAISCVLRISAVSHTPSIGAVALLAGDIEKPQEQALVERNPSLKADVLLVPHHGSKTSSSSAFLQAVQPRIAFVQAGYRNRFGHPAPEVLQRYLERQVQVIESTRCGAATWSSAAPQRVRCERAAEPRYWQHRMNEAAQ